MVQLFYLIDFLRFATHNSAKAPKLRIIWPALHRWTTFLCDFRAHILAEFLDIWQQC